MNKKTREALKSAGYWVGDAEDFLQLTEEERRLVESLDAVGGGIESVGALLAPIRPTKRKPSARRR